MTAGSETQSSGKPDPGAPRKRGKRGALDGGALFSGDFSVLLKGEIRNGKGSRAERKKGQGRVPEGVNELEFGEAEWLTLLQDQGWRRMERWLWLSAGVRSQITAVCNAKRK